LLSDKMMSCCAAGTNGCLDLRHRAFALGEQVSAECSRCTVHAPLHGVLETCGSFATKLSKLDFCEDRKVVRWCRVQASSHNLQDVIDGRINEAGVSTAALDRRAVLCSIEWVAVRNVVAPAPQPEPASLLKSVTHDVNFLRSDSWCRRYLSDLSNVTPRYLGS